MKRKIILIQSDNAYYKFLNKIKFYKSIFYCNTKFEFINETGNDLPEIESIIMALNIKQRKRRIKYIYNQACLMIDDNNNEKNICGFKNRQCYVQRKLKNGKCNGCCRKCLYQSEKGCTTNNLACKLFNCTEVKLRYNTLNYNDLKILKVLSLKNQFIVKSDYFSKEEDILKDLYCYTFVFSTIRVIFRFIKNYVLCKIKYEKI